MREKSSSVFTSRSRRRLLQQREGGAELVADVAEEGRLGAVQLGQRLGTPALLLIGAGIADGGADLAGDQRAEAAIGIVETQARAEAEHQQAGRAMRGGGWQRQHQCLVRRVGPRPR
jgi:hypothetical protein